jgi:DnaJ-class molecular chaperone
MPEKDLYHELGVSRDASEDELRRSYRKLARTYHPDVNPDDPGAEERFKEISFAYEVLSDPEKRKIYNEFGHEGLAAGFSPEQARAYRDWSRGAGQGPFGADSGFHFEDLFEGLFGGRVRHGPQRGPDVQAEVSVDFLDAVMGREVRVQVPERGTLRVRIPAGAEDGTRVRLGGQGRGGPGTSPPGDLYLVVRVRPHPFFTRDEADLFVDVPVTVPELILGTTVDVPTPDGSVSMKLPPRSPNGRKLRLRGQGGALRGSDERGDLYVRLVAELPDTPDEKLEELARELEPLYGDHDVRERLKRL